MTADRPGSERQGQNTSGCVVISAKGGGYVAWLPAFAAMTRVVFARAMVAQLLRLTLLLPRTAKRCTVRPNGR